MGPPLPNPPYNANYNVNDFFDRYDALQMIVNTFMQPGPDHRQSILVEAPSGQGKSWLFQHVFGEINRPYAADPIALCYLEATDFLLPPVGGAHLNNFTYSLLARVWRSIHRTFPTLPWPVPPPTPVSHTQLVLFLQNESTTHWVDLIHNTLSAHPHPYCLILIFDALEEIDPQRLRQFEREVLRFLFSHEQVYLLAARRIPSPIYRWREFTIKNKTTILELASFSRIDADTQLAALLAGSPFAAADFFSQCRVYTGRNPRANAFLAGRFIANQGHLTPTDFRPCLGELMLLNGQQLSPQYVDWLQISIQSFQATISDPGVQTYQLNGALKGIPDAERDAFLEHLQDHGIGQFTAGGWFTVSRDFVELFLEL